MFINRKKITTQWFFASPPTWCQFLGIYVNGDALVLVPLIIVLIFVSAFSVHLGLQLISAYITFRGLGEMIYWLFQQFGPKTYRPDDFGFVNLNNDAIYIIYQLRSLVNILIGIAIFLYMK